MAGNADSSGQAVEIQKNVYGIGADEEQIVALLKTQAAALSEAVKELQQVNLNLKGLGITIEGLRQTMLDD
jgi:hypothetical protein